MGTPDALAAVAILNVILHDEVGHVAIGNHWYAGCANARAREPETLYGTLVQKHEAPA